MNWFKERISVMSPIALMSSVNWQKRTQAVFLLPNLNLPKKLIDKLKYHEKGPARNVYANLKMLSITKELTANIKNVKYIYNYL